MIKLSMKDSLITAWVTAQTLYNCVSAVEDCNPNATNAKTSLLGTAPFIKEIVIDVDTGSFRGMRVSYFGTPHEADLVLESHSIASAMAALMLCNCGQQFGSPEKQKLFKGE